MSTVSYAKICRLLENLKIYVCALIFCLRFTNISKLMFAKFQENRHVLGSKHILVNRKLHTI